jgi:gliding motility-associated-like protein
MIKIFKISLIIFALTQNCVSQNVVWRNVTSDYINNPDFEDHLSCPQGLSSPSFKWIESCIGWTTPTMGTSDYYNICNNNISGIVGIPQNYAGFQNPYSGVAYCGFLGYSVWQNVWCEYIQTELKQPLIKDKEYFFSLRIIMADSMAFANSNLGVLFSSLNYKNEFSTAPIDEIPQINSSSFITNFINWQSLSGHFIAKGDEKFLTIGWFDDSLSTDFLQLNFDTLALRETYYLVDSINLWEFESNNQIENFNINTITPNSDGINETLDFSVYNLTKLNFTLFNRWGQMVFDSNDNELKWSGFDNKGKPLTDGVYYYVLEALIDNKTITKRNFISIFTNQ